MATIPTSVRELLATGPLVTLATIDEDGSPYLTITLADIDGDEIVCATFFELDQRKLRNMRRDPRVAISFAAKEHAGEGLHPYVSIRGGPDHGGWRARGDGPPRAELLRPRPCTRCARCPRGS